MEIYKHQSEIVISPEPIDILKVLVPIRETAVVNGFDY